MRLGLCIAVAAGLVGQAVANSEVFQINRDYLCATQEAYYAAPQLASHGVWSEPPARFQVRIQVCEVYCLPQKSKQRPLSLHILDPGQDQAQKFEGYRGQASFHSLSGGSVTVSATGLSMTRMMVGSMPGAENQVSLVLAAICHPIETGPAYLAPQ